MKQTSLCSPPNAASSPPSAREIEAAVASAVPAIRARALETERARRVPDENIALLEKAGFFGVSRPARFGGYEQDFEVLAGLIMQVAAACASTGWVAGLLASHQWLLGLFPEQAQRDVWDGELASAALVCGSYAPACKALAAPGGFRLTGKWAFASGCDNSVWAFCATLVPTKDEAAFEPAFLLVPASDYAIEDTWDTVGLAGTGSKTLVLEDVFVPAHRQLLFAEAAAGSAPGAAFHGSGLFRVPIHCHIAACLAATGVGAGLGALDDYIASTRVRTTRGSVTGGNSRMAEFPTVQIKVAEAAAALDAARTILLRDLAAVASRAHEGRAISVDDRVRNRRGQAFAVSLAVKAVDTLNASTGGNGLALSNPVQRAWRDVNAVGRHISLNWDSVGAMSGQLLLGLEPRGQY